MGKRVGDLVFRTAALGVSTTCAFCIPITASIFCFEVLVSAIKTAVMANNMRLLNITALRTKTKGWALKSVVRAAHIAFRSRGAKLRYWHDKYPFKYFCF
jgi:hypothetical protein